MVSTSDFNKLSNIKGIAQFILVRKDGHVVTHNSPKMVELSSTIVMSGRNCQKLEEFLESGNCIYLHVEREQGSNLLIFSLGKYFLGVIEKTDSDTKKTVDSIISYLKKL